MQRIPKRFNDIVIGQSAADVMRLIGAPGHIAQSAQGTVWSYFSGRCEIVLSVGERPVVIKVVILSV
jgi:hypothetical protein